MTNEPLTEPELSPRTEDAFLATVRDLMDRDHDYETSANALRDVAVAAFNYAASVLGVTGFQAGWASMGVYREVNSIDGPFGIVRAESLLFPQYPKPSAKAREFEKEWATWAKEQAVEKLTEEGSTGAGWIHPDVWQHWIDLAGDDAPEGTITKSEMRARMDAAMEEFRAEREAQR